MRQLEATTYTVNPGQGSLPTDIVRTGFPTVPEMAIGVSELLAALNSSAANFCATFIPMNEALGPRSLVLDMHANAADGNTAEERAYLVTPALFGGKSSIQIRQVIELATWTCGPSLVTEALGAPSATHRMCRNISLVSTGWLESLAFLGPLPFDKSPAAYVVPFVPRALGYLRVTRLINGTGWRPAHLRFG